MKQINNIDGSLKGFISDAAGVEVHGHIHHPGEWLYTVRSLGIHGERLCVQSETDIDTITKLVTKKLDAKVRAIVLIKERLTEGV